MSKEEILNFDYNAKYENIDLYIPEGMDIIPELPTFWAYGLGMKEHDKLFLYYRIQRLKELAKDEEATEEDIKMINESVKELIEKYDSMEI